MISKHESDVTGKSRLISNITTSWLSQFAMIIVGFFMPRIINDQLGQEVLGLWDLAWSLVAYVSLANLGIGSSLNRFVSNYRADNEIEKLRTATSTVIAIQTVISIIVVIIITGSAYYLPYIYADLGDSIVTAQFVIFFLGLSIAAQFLFDTSRGVLTGCHRWDIYNALNAGTNVVCSLLMIGALLLGKGLIEISVIYFFCTFLEGLSRSYVARRVCPESKWQIGAVSRSFAREILRFGSSLFILGLIPIIVYQTTNILIATILGPAVLAVFARHNALLRMLRTFITKFTYVLTPMAGPILAKEGPEKLRDFLISCTSYAFALTLPPTTLFCLYGDELIGIWMGSNYINSNLVLILGLGMVLRLSLNPSIRILIGLNYHGRISIVGSTISLVIYAAGAMAIHYIGASVEAYAFLLSLTMTLVYGLLIPAYACRRLDISFTSYLVQSTKRVFPIWAAATLLLIGVEIVVQENILTKSINAVAYAIVILTLYWLFLIPDEMRNKFSIKFFTRGNA